jgi:hypothetical protein
MAKKNSDQIQTAADSAEDSKDSIYLTDEPKSRFSFLKTKTAKVVGISAAGALVLGGAFAAGAVVGRFGFDDHRPNFAQLNPFGAEAEFADQGPRDFDEDGDHGFRGPRPPHAHDQFGNDIVPAPMQDAEDQYSEQP